MGRSWALLLTGLGLLCLGTIVAVTTVLPTGGIDPHWSPYLRLPPPPGPTRSYPGSTIGDIGQRFGLSPNPAPNRLVPQAEDDNLFRYALRPFGIHRPGLGGIALYLGSLLAFASLGLIVIYFFPQRLFYLVQHLGQSWAAFGEAGLLGLVSYLFLAVLGALLTLTVVGLPFAVLLGLAVIGLSFLGLVAAASTLGQRLAALLGIGGTFPLLWWMAGLLVLFALGILPVIGWFAVALTIVFGFGAIVRTRLGSNQPQSPNPIVGNPSQP